MAAAAAPYGLRPVQMTGQDPTSGGFNQIKIASGYATNIFFGDIVAIDSAGTCTKVTATGADGTTNAFPAGVVGVFLGCTFTDPVYGKTFRQYWPASTVAADAMAYVYDNHNGVFQIQASGSLAQTALGSNVTVVQTAGSTVTGNSKVAANAAGTGTDTFRPLRIVGFVESTSSTVGDAFTDILVRFNTGIHSYTSGTGV